MIVSQLIQKQGICSLVVESPDDLWTLRRLVAPGDTVVTKSSRVVKNESEYSRPDRGERVKVTIAMVVSDVSLDSSIGRLRIRGKIVEASDDSVTTAGTHSVSVTPGYGLTLKKKEWSPVYTTILNSAKDKGGRFLIVTVDRRESGVGLLSGSHLTIVLSLESGVGGKGAKEADTAPFIRKTVDALRNSWRDGDKVVIAGPGNTKLALASRVAEDPDLGKSYVVIDGFDLAGADGVRGLIKFEPFQQVARESVLVEVQGIVNETIRRMARGDTRVAYTLPRVKEAAGMGAVEKCVVTDGVFTHNTDEELVVSVLNSIEEQGGGVYLCDSSLEMGKQVSAFGGIIATLRFPLRTWQ
ncbi:MAG: hypothetical protein OK456_06375 [Thaumarchaeota archaeon]|nr:hypothetical protein [Nitrososphaerota archaeon]